LWAALLGQTVARLRGCGPRWDGRRWASVDVDLGFRWRFGSIAENALITGILVYSSLLVSSAGWRARLAALPCLAAACRTSCDRTPPAPGIAVRVVYRLARPSGKTNTSAGQPAGCFFAAAAITYVVHRASRRHLPSVLASVYAFLGEPSLLTTRTFRVWVSTVAAAVNIGVWRRRRAPPAFERRTRHWRWAQFCWHLSSLHCLSVMVRAVHLCLRPFSCRFGRMAPLSALFPTW